MLFVPSDVRLRLGRWGVGDAVLIERLATRQRWTASRAIAATLTAFSGGRTRRQGADSAAEALGVSRDELLRQIDVLEEIGLLATVASDPDPLADQWRRHGWIAAYDHHMTTWDFPLVDYTADGRKVDQARMESYRNSEPDPGPLAHDYCAGLPTSLNLAEAAQIDLAAPLTTVLHNTKASAPLNSRRLCILLAKTFCFTAKQGAGKTRRTSPSGGARHPAEGSDLRKSA
ncbi:MAG: hypothetical protein ACRDTD_22385 [Pseudonocardiaceae bacterium]